MNVTIIAPDKVVIIDGYPLNFDFAALIAANIHAVQFDGTAGEVEYSSPDVANELISDVAEFQPIIEQFFSLKTVLEAEIAAKADTLKTVKFRQLREAYKTAIHTPVVDANNISWGGGFDSAIKMDAAKRMAELGLQTHVSLFDDNNTEHVLTLAAAETVVLTVGNDFQTKFAHKQALMIAVEALPDTATQAQLDNIVVLF